MTSRPFLFRLVLPFAAIIVLTVVVCGAVIYFAGVRRLHAEQISELNRLASLVRERVASTGTELTPVQREQLQSLSHVLDTRITLIDSEGHVTFDSHADASQMDNHNTRPEVVEARQRGVGSTVRVSDTLRERSVCLATPVNPDDRAGTILRLTYPERVWPQVSANIGLILLVGVLVAGLSLAVLSWMLHRKWVAPVREMAHAAERMAGGEWGARVEPRGADDLQFFSAKLNIVASQAQRQLAELRDQRQDLQSLVDSLPDPILLSDAQGRIALVNTPAATLLDLSPGQVIGRSFVSVVPDHSIIELLDQTGRAGDSSRHRELRISRNGRHITYQAVAIPARSGGVLLVLRNISAMATTVQMKTDFVANASHELRTPISAIKIAFETLRDVQQDDPGQAARCIGVIDGQITRLEEMLADLLDLSRVEDADAQPVITRVRAGELFDSLSGAMLQQARQKQVALVLGDESQRAMEFHSDRRLIELILKNLVENSIKFTPPGGSVTVTIERKTESSQVVLSVADTGIGISPENIERVFERFYQVDPARSGSTGRGTGLGLAIVKHAMHTLGGEVHLKSAVGEGTTISCVLPEGNQKSESPGGALPRTDK